VFALFPERKKHIMDHELWAQLSHAMFDVARVFPKTARQTYDTHRIVRVYLWAVLHDRTVDWATRPASWTPSTRPGRIPDQSTLSRRLRAPEVRAFLDRLAPRVGGKPHPGLVKALDGKPLTVARHSKDPDATCGRGVGGMAKGYKLHAIWGQSPMPLAWSVHPLNVSEVREARNLIASLPGEGSLLGDSNYDRNPLYELAAQARHQLVAPRMKPGTGLGSRRHSPHRLRSIHLLERAPSDFGPMLYQLRTTIERQFGGLVSFGGGLQSLPPWVRTLPRVRLFVHAKLLINAARLRRIGA
jgi:hypothetical protein